MQSDSIVKTVEKGAIGMILSVFSHLSLDQIDDILSISSTLIIGAVSIYKILKSDKKNG